MNKIDKIPCPVELFILAVEQRTEQIINIISGAKKRNRKGCHINIITVGILS